jgi:hypothetical protein
MFKRSIPTLVALICGWLVLLGTLLPIPVLIQIRSLLIDWASVLGVFALILASLSVVGVHARRIQRGPNKVTSAIIILATIGSFMLVIMQGPYGELPQLMLNSILVPGESALLALTAVTLILAGMRIFQTRRNWEGLVFVFIVVIMLFVAVPYFYPTWLIQAINTLATSGMRGLLIGVALGTTLTGFRILFGTDRPYSDE